jgi:hypothetical protein
MKLLFNLALFLIVFIPSILRYIDRIRSKHSALRDIDGKPIWLDDHQHHHSHHDSHHADHGHGDSDGSHGDGSGDSGGSH